MSVCCRDSLSPTGAQFYSTNHRLSETSNFVHVKLHKYYITSADYCCEIPVKLAAAVQVESVVCTQDVASGTRSNRGLENTQDIFSKIFT